MRLLQCASASVLVLALFTGAQAQKHEGVVQRTKWTDVYFLAAAPEGLDAQQTHPASLYMLGNGHSLRLVREFFRTGQHFSDFADDLHGDIYLAGRNGIYVVHTQDPTRAEFVPLTNFDGSFCWGAVYGGEAGAAVQYCPSKLVARVNSRASNRKPRVEEGSWQAFKHLQYGGESDGIFGVGPPVARIDGAKLVMPQVSAPHAVLAQLPAKDESNPKERRRTWILASTDRYLVVWIVPESMGAFGSTKTVDAAHRPFHATPVQVLVLDRQAHKWRTMELPTTISSPNFAPVRMMGNWLVITVMDWSPPKQQQNGASRGIAKKIEKTPMYSGNTSVGAAYARRFLNVHIPGKLEAWNLVDGRKLTLKTGEPDSEVLLIRKDGSMLYRQGNAIYSARIERDKIGAPELLAKSKDAKDIHWAFEGSK